MIQSLNTESTREVGGYTVPLSCEHDADGRVDLRCGSQNDLATRDGLALTERQFADPNVGKCITKPILLSTIFGASKATRAHLSTATVVERASHPRASGVGNDAGETPAPLL